MGIKTWFKRPVNVDFEDRLAELEQRFAKIKREVVELAFDNENLRDKVLRKIQQKRKVNEEEGTPPALDGLPRL